MIETLSSIEFWQNLRNIVIYPILAVTGLAWAIGFYLHYAFTGSISNRWAGRVGLSVAIFAMCGMSALSIAQRSGFSLMTTVIFTFGMAAPSAVMMWGTVWLLHQYLSARRHK